MKNNKLIILVICIVFLIITIYVVKNLLFKEPVKETSDAIVETETLSWAGDNYLGYSFLHSIEMKKQLASNGLVLNFTNDNGDYETRLKKFAKNEFDFIVLPVNSYIEHGAKYNYPGVIVAGISESKGADAIVGFKDILQTGNINDLNNPDLHIYYTPKSPSSFLLDLTISDFDLYHLKHNNNWKREVIGVDEVFKMAENAKVDANAAYVMWEPNVTLAINELGMKRLWGSDMFEGYIIDVIVFHRNVVLHRPERIENFLKTYFKVINYYSIRYEEMLEEVSKISSIHENVASMIKNINWYDFHENCSNLFKIQINVGLPAKDGIVNSIYACNDVLLKTKAIENEVTNPYSLINSSFLRNIKDDVLKSVDISLKAAKVEFEILSKSEWSSLKEIGTLRNEPIIFMEGTSMLSSRGEKILEKVAKLLVNNYPYYRISIRGHTGQTDQESYSKLSAERAMVVKQKLIEVYRIDPNRLHSVGLGGKQPPLKKLGESPEEYNKRRSRVEFVLLENSSI